MNLNFRQISIGVGTVVLCIVTGVYSVRSQSSDQNFPTAVTTNEITGSIAARDIGDSRRTTYYYTFDGDQGDLFVNIVTNNLTADVDIFRVNGLLPLTKVVVYGDLTEAETGRVVYLRKREQLLLRVQGRTPNDDPATFRIKFAGSFIAARPSDDERPQLPELTAGNRVNSVGTIIPPKRIEPVKEEVAIAEQDIPAEVPFKKDAHDEVEAKVTEDEIAAADKPALDKPEAESKEEPKDELKDEPKKPEVIVTENIAVQPAKEVENKKAVDPERIAEKAAERTPDKRVEKKDEKPVDPLASINLVIIFRDGGRIERPMSEVLRFTIDKGILTVISKDGRIGRYSILDVERTIIE